jgi:hypothetical protein
MLPPSWKSELEKLVLEENNREEQSKQTTQDADITAGLVAIKQQLETANEQQASAESRQKRFDIFTALFVFATALFTGLSWWVFSGQLTEMKQVYKPIKEQADITRDAMIASSRAWLAPRNAFFIKELGLNQPWSITVIYGNVGKEPALGFAAQEDFGSVEIPKLNESWFSVFPKSTLGDVCGRFNASDGGLTIYPSGPTDHSYSVSGDRSTFDVTTEILQGTRVMFMHGCFAYKTVGPPPHKSECCFLFIPDIDPKTGQKTYRSISCMYGNNAS